MKTKELYTKNHTRDLSNKIPDPEYDKTTKKMRQLNDQWQDVYNKLKQWLGKPPF